MTLVVQLIFFPFFSMRIWLKGKKVKIYISMCLVPVDVCVFLCILYFRAVLSTIMLVSLSCLILAYM